MEVSAGPESAEQWRGCLFFCSLRGPLFYHYESSSNEPVRLLREYRGIYQVTPVFVVRFGTDFLFRAAWTLPTPQVQQKGFDAMAWLGTRSPLGDILGPSQVPLAATTFLPPMQLADQPR